MKIFQELTRKFHAVKNHAHSYLKTNKMGNYFVNHYQKEDFFHLLQTIHVVLKALKY